MDQNLFNAIILAVSVIGVLPDLPTPAAVSVPVLPKKEQGRLQWPGRSPRFTGPEKGQHGFPNVVGAHQAS